jgi:hypothetical protein
VGPVREDSKENEKCMFLQKIAVYIICKEAAPYKKTQITERNYYISRLDPHW